ncbi:DNA topoisomerase IB [Saxibacter everestensis]|uniref:DNA topoisomerase n=1 Tax=Saxibacter everestensis TaxID=2909229 RepID=A0ABY8QTH8_9MICO|nr:DNA topoisomerase IB [Brevibacteriaceae bacterium ZFBP1038]
MRLRKSDQTKPGITRRRRGRGWQYFGPDGRTVDSEARSRVEALVIPPAWTDVWISPWHNGHIQAVGTDDAGRRQYLYHELWVATRNSQKHVHGRDVGKRLPEARKLVARHLALPGMPRERALATAFRMLDVGRFRAGNQEYAESNGSFGLATLLKSHVRIDGDALVFDYAAKSGVRRISRIEDSHLLDSIALMRRRRTGGEQLLAYRDHGRWIALDSADVNDYLRDVVGAETTAKDFRTWHATVLAAAALAAESRRLGAEPWSQTARKKAVSQVMRFVADELGNTPAVARGSYVDPRIVDLFWEGTTIGDAGRRGVRLTDDGDPLAGVLDVATSEAAETAVIRLLV